MALTNVVAIAVGPPAPVIITEVEKIQPFTSLTSTPYVPAVRLGYTRVAVNALPSTEYVYGATPPVTAPSVIDPLEAPHVALTTVEAIALGPPALLTEAVVENVHPLTSLTSMEYVPAARLGYARVAVNGLPLTEYVYGATPPVTAPRVIDPLEAPQVAFTMVVAIAVGPPALLTEAVVEKVHPLTSLTSMEYVPAARLGYASVPVNALPSTE